MPSSTTWPRSFALVSEQLLEHAQRELGLPRRAARQRGDVVLDCGRADLVESDTDASFDAGRLSIAVRVYAEAVRHGEPPASTQDREGAATRLGAGQAAGRGRESHQRSGRQASRQHARAGSAGTRHQPGHPRPTRRAGDRDREDRVGCAAIPAAELDRYLAERTEEPRAPYRRTTRGGRRSTLPAEVVSRILHESARGASLADIGRRLNRDRIPTAQGGRQWWPSTVRVVLESRNSWDAGNRAADREEEA